MYHYYCDGWQFPRWSLYQLGKAVSERERENGISDVMEEILLSLSIVDAAAEIAEMNIPPFVGKCVEHLVVCVDHESCSICKAPVDQYEFVLCRRVVRNDETLLHAAM